MKEPRQIDSQKILAQVSRVIFQQDSTEEALEVAVKALHSLLGGISGIQGAIKNRAEGFETKLSSGMALSPGYAADCTLDTRRTVKYMRALDAAVQKLKGDFPGRRINVLYAGTGPFAPFAVALTERYSPDEVGFTALDIHLQSLDALKKVVAALELDDYFQGYVQADATEYSHPAQEPLHVVITETMHRTVSREPHAAITLNLMPQLTEGGIFIPEGVTVRASMSILEKELAFLDGRLDAQEVADVRVDMGPVFELNKGTSYDTTEDGSELICATTTVPEIPDDYDELVLSTRLQLFGSIALEEKESGITHPFLLRTVETPVTGDKLQFRFRLTDFPELLCEKIIEEDIFAKLEKTATSV